MVAVLQLQARLLLWLLYTGWWNGDGTLVHSLLCPLWFSVALNCLNSSKSGVFFPCFDTPSNTEAWWCLDVPHINILLIGQSTYFCCLFGGLEHEFYDFPLILGMSSSQLTNSIIFQRGRSTTNQLPINSMFVGKNPFVGCWNPRCSTNKVCCRLQAIPHWLCFICNSIYFILYIKYRYYIIYYIIYIVYYIYYIYIYYISTCLYPIITSKSTCISSDISNETFQDFIGGATIALICLVQTLAHAAIATTKVIQGQRPCYSEVDLLHKKCVLFSVYWWLLWWFIGEFYYSMMVYGR